MYYTTRQDGFDDPRHTKRGPSWDFGEVLGLSLRMGFGLQLISLTFLYFVFWANGGSGLYGYDFTSIQEPIRQSQSFRNAFALFSGLYLLGSLYILCFQASLADDACWARGFRAGSKIMRYATTLDTISSLLQFVFGLYLAKFYSDKWFNHFNQGGSEWVFFAFTRILHALAFFMYAGGTFLLEVYHDEGAGDLHAYINAVMFGLTGLFEMMFVFSRNDHLITSLIWISLLMAFIWAYFFEPEVNALSPAMHETELTNDVEQQVEMFASKSSYAVQQSPMQNLYSNSNSMNFNQQNMGSYKANSDQYFAQMQN